MPRSGVFFGRRFLNSPVTGTIELVEIGMALVAFLAMPRAFYLNANVSADFINNLNLGIFKTYLVILKFVLMISIMSLMAYSTTILLLIIEAHLSFSPLLPARAQTANTTFIILFSSYHYLILEMLTPDPYPAIISSMIVATRSGILSAGSGPTI